MSAGGRGHRGVTGGGAPRRRGATSRCFPRRWRALLIPPLPPSPPLNTPPRFASCGGDRQVFLWDVSTGAIVRKFRGHDATINAVRPALCWGEQRSLGGGTGGGLGWAGLRGFDALVAASPILPP